MYLAGFIRSFRLKDREDYNPQAQHALFQVLRGMFIFFASCQYVALFLSRREIYFVCTFHDRFINH